MSEELREADIYSAFQIAGSVVIIASGKHKVPEHAVQFQDTPIAVFPPEYKLVHIASSDPTTQVENPFVAYISFPATDAVDRVVVHDANGRREIKVEQTNDINRIIRCLLPGNPSTTPD